MAVLVIWGGAILFGESLLAQYSLTPGSIGEVRASWPEGSRFRRAEDGRSTAILFLHPKCPCSAASVDELDRFLAQTDRRVKAVAVFVRPPKWTDDDVQSDLWKQAGAIPNVERRIDRDGEEARRFGALTSGQFFLYRPSGYLVFQGGITPSRGHRGDNSGLSAAVDWVTVGSSSVTATKPFGCALFSRNERGAE